MYFYKYIFTVKAWDHKMLYLIIASGGPSHKMCLHSLFTPTAYVISAVQTVIVNVHYCRTSFCAVKFSQRAVYDTWCNAIMLSLVISLLVCAHSCVLEKDLQCGWDCTVAYVVNASRLKLAFARCKQHWSRNTSCFSL